MEHLAMEHTHTHTCNLHEIANYRYFTLIHSAEPTMISQYIYQEKSQQQQQH